jgi:hypothetical protein
VLAERAAAGGESIGDGSMDGEEAWGGTSGAEAVRAFGSVVLALASDVVGGQTEFTGRGPVGAVAVHRFETLH